MLMNKANQAIAYRVD